MALENVASKSVVRQLDPNSGAKPSPTSDIAPDKDGIQMRDGAHELPRSSDGNSIGLARVRVVPATPRVSDPERQLFRSKGYVPRRHLPNLSAALFMLDVFCIGIGQVAWFQTISWRIASSGPVEVLTVAAVATLVNTLFLCAFGSYRRETLVGFGLSASRAFAAIAFSSIVLFVLLYYVMRAIHAPYFTPDILSSAVLVLLGSGISLVSIALSRLVTFTFLTRQWLTRRILVIGSGKRAQYLKGLMERAPHRLVNDLIFVPESVIDGDWNETSHGVSSAISSLQGRSVDTLSRDLLIDEIVVSIDEGRQFSFEPLLACKANGTPVIDYSSFIERETSRVDLNRPDLSWLVYSNGFQLSLVDICLKRGLDVLVSLVLLFISTPVLLFATAAVAIGRDGPVVFKQQRVTLNGRVFWLYKIRTMRQDAESDGPRWSHAKDPRITRVGAILRRFRIDEIPQLVNVLQGDMSLVGPRPEQPHFVEQLSRDIRFYNLRHTVKAGITGWAQINYPYGGSVDDAERKLEYDLYYIKNFNFLWELSIILQTLRVLIWPPSAR